MSSRSMQFEGMTIGAIDLRSNRAEIQVDHAIIIKNMDDAERDTRWYGRGCLIITDLFQKPDELPKFPAKLASADIRDNQMIYRGEVNIPFEFHGNVGITLVFADDQSPLKFFGENMTFSLSEHERYIEHI